MKGNNKIKAGDGFGELSQGTLIVLIIFFGGWIAICIVVLIYAILNL